MSTRSDVVVQSSELTLKFCWNSDRYGHEIQSGNDRQGSDGPGKDQLVAIEAAGYESPVYTEIHSQGDLLFLSGMSADRHWSASVEPTATGFRFDVACRLHSMYQRLGSVYSGERLVVEPAEQISDSAWFVGLQNAAGPFPQTVQYRYTIACSPPS